LNFDSLGRALGRSWAGRNRGSQKWPPVRVSSL